MDKAALEDLFAYTGWAWEQIKAAIPDEENLRSIAPGSGWPALRNCLAHIVLAYDRWVPAIIDLETRPMPDLASDDFLTWSQIDTHRRLTRSALQSAIEKSTDADLREHRRHSRRDVAHLGAPLKAKHLRDERLRRVATSSLNPGRLLFSEGAGRRHAQ